MCLSGYRSVRNKLFTRVDFPSPDSPTKQSSSSSSSFGQIIENYTMVINLFELFLKNASLS